MLVKFQLRLIVHLAIITAISVNSNTEKYNYVSEFLSVPKNCSKTRLYFLIVFMVISNVTI